MGLRADRGVSQVSQSGQNETVWDTFGPKTAFFGVVFAIKRAENGSKTPKIGSNTAKIVPFLQRIRANDASFDREAGVCGTTLVRPRPAAGGAHLTCILGGFGSKFAETSRTGDIPLRSVNSE